MSWARRAFSLGGRRSRLVLLIAAVAIVAALVFFEAILISMSAPNPTGQITGVQIRFINQGSTPDGLPWFGTQEVNYSGAADGYPFAFEPGSTVNISVQPVNHDVADHSIGSFLVNAPFHAVGSYPKVPFTAEAGDDFLLQVAIATPASTGAYQIDLTIVVGS